MKKLVLATGLIAVAFASCKKNDNNSTNGNNNGSSGNTALLSTGKWVEIAETSQTIDNGVAGPVSDDYKDLRACEKDDTTYFLSTKVMMIDAGTLKCGSEAQQYSVGQWSLQNNDTTLIQGMPTGGGINWHIDQLTSTTLQITNTSTDNTGTVVYKSSETFKHYN